MIPEVLLLISTLSLFVYWVISRVINKPHNDVQAALENLYNQGHISRDEYVKSKKALRH